jgi:hypothetical protein
MVPVTIRPVRDGPSDPPEVFEGALSAMGAMRIVSAAVRKALISRRHKRVSRKFHVKISSYGKMSYSTRVLGAYGDITGGLLKDTYAKKRLYPRTRPD